jgi:AcrR family transcriptional regulator
MPRSNARNEQMRAESRANILATARQLFAERGYDGCSVSDIARQAGMSQGNIYWYFPSKEDVLKAVLAEAFEGLAALFEEVAAHPGTGREKLDHLIQRYIDFGQDRGGAETTIIVASLTAQGGLKRLADLGVNTSQIGAESGGAVAAIVAQAQAEGAIQSGIDPRLSAVFFFSLFNGLVFTYRDEVAAIPREVLHETALRLVGSKEG